MRASQERLLRICALAVVSLFTCWLLWPASLSGNTSALSGAINSNGLSPSSKGEYQRLKSYTGVNNLGYQYQVVERGAYNGPKEKACFVTLARNSDLYGLLRSIKSVEDRFNNKFQYDWVFLNDEEFTDEFKRLTSALISGETKYGLVPKSHWSFPEWIDLDKAAKTREEMRAKQILYGDSISYRFMCRYESGLFFQHPLMDDYEWYWRVEPDVELFCDIDYDLFKFMKDNGKKYSFTVSIYEYEETIKTLWSTTKDFFKEHPNYLHKNNMLDFISDDGGDSYNMCHFWSNFEVASLDLWRGEAYMKYFEYLDKSGGFFYERWGDAPVHSIAAALILDRNEIHHFDDVAYYHPPFTQCPIDENLRIKNKCSCKPSDDFTWAGYSCTNRYYTVNKLQKPKGWHLFAS
ncbi:alpha-1,2-mannosyltransferase ktr1 [Hanseniaspora vineae]